MFEPLPQSDLAEADADLNSRDMPFVSMHRSLFRVRLSNSKLPCADVNLKRLGTQCRWCERDKEREARVDKPKRDIERPRMSERPPRESPSTESRRGNISSSKRVGTPGVLRESVCATEREQERESKRARERESERERERAREREKESKKERERERERERGRERGREESARETVQENKRTCAREMTHTQSESHSLMHTYACACT